MEETGKRGRAHSQHTTTQGRVNHRTALKLPFHYERKKIKTSLQVVSCGLTSFDKLMNHDTEAAAEVHRVLILCLHIVGLFISHLTKNHLITISSPSHDT